MNKKFLLVALGSLLFVCQAASARLQLTFEERVKAQEAIERVYYNHRIWPKENPTPKPPFEQMVPRAMLEAKVTDYLKKSAALGEFWQRPIQPEQLQAEMDRMAKGTKDPATLRELFAALKNDPYIVAECLARPVLADRLIRNWYANDERFHADTKAKAEAALASAGGGSLSLCSEGQYQKVVYVLSDSDDAAFPQYKPRSEIALDSARLEKELQQTPGEGMPAVLREAEETFILSRTALKTSTRIEVESLVFPKKDIGEWLKNVELSGLVDQAFPGRFAFAIPPTPEANCTGDTWAPTSTGTHCPSARQNNIAIWTGTEMIVWGGNGGDGGLNDGGRYNPSTDSWTVTSTGANCPSARSGHTAVWTGSEMIIWGGANDATGGRYNPLSDSWIPTSTGANCPSGRYYPTSVWTGTEMIVWGGYYYDSSAHFLNTGARYAPSIDGWIPTSVGANCPSPRYSHSVVWTGTEMIIWGGCDGFGGSAGGSWFNTGGRYNPSTDSWTATSTVSSCPSPRSDQTAVWTGVEMIVWGGSYYDSGTDTEHYLNTGARYNPSSDSWAATATAADCPLGRATHTALWAGGKMIVWGGQNPNMYGLNTGGRYNPSTNSWIATSTGTNCPFLRYLHTAVWTGTSMIVWGGLCDFMCYMNTGGIYFTGVPYEVPVTSLSWTGTDKDTLSWSAASCATGYRIYRGDPSRLPNLPTGAPACRSYDGTGMTTGATLTADPPAGSFYWYVAVGYDAAGEGPAGQSSYGPRMILSTGTCLP